MKNSLEPQIPKFSLKFKVDVSKKNTVVGEAMIFVNGKLLSRKKPIKLK